MEFSVDYLEKIDSHRLASLIELDKQMDYPWNQSSWMVESQIHAHEDVLAWADGPQFCGFCLFRLYREENCAHLLKIVVDEQHREQGIARELLRASYAFIEAFLPQHEWFLDVRENNQVALNLYQKWGLKTLLLRSQFYTDGQSAWSLKGRPRPC